MSFIFVPGAGGGGGSGPVVKNAAAVTLTSSDTLQGNAATAGTVTGFGQLDANGQLGVPQLYPAYTTTAYGAVVTPVANSYVRIEATGDITIDTPSAPIDGAEVRLWVSNTTGGNINVAMQAAIVIPTSSSFVSPYVLAAGKKLKLMLQYDADQNGGQWELTSLVGNY